MWSNLWEITRILLNFMLSKVAKTSCCIVASQWMTSRFNTLQLRTEDGRSILKKKGEVWTTGLVLVILKTFCFFACLQLNLKWDLLKKAGISHFMAQTWWFKLTSTVLSSPSQWSWAWGSQDGLRPACRRGLSRLCAQSSAPTTRESENVRKNNASYFFLKNNKKMT